MNLDTLTIDGTLGVDTRRPVYYFDLAPVAARSRALKNNPDGIELMCRQCVRRHAPGELTLFRDGGFFLAIQSCAGEAAETMARNVNVALLELFFGTDSVSGLTLFRTAEHAEIADAGVPDMVAAQAVPARRALTRPDLETVSDDPLARLAEGGVPGYDGLRAGFLPMLNLRRDAASIFMCGAVGRRSGKPVFGSRALSEINPQDRPSIDHAMLEYAVGFARGIVPTKFAAAIGISVSFETLAWSRGRRIYQEALRAANVAENPFLLVKIEDVPAGTRVGRLAEIVATVRPYVKRVFVEVPDCETGLTFGGQIGAAGLVASLSENATPAEAARVAARLARTASAQQALSCIDGVGCADALARVREAGVRFASGRVGEDNLAIDFPMPGSELRAA